MAVRNGSRTLLLSVSLAAALTGAGGCDRQPDPTAPERAATRRDASANAADAPRATVSPNGVPMVLIRAGEFLMGSDGSVDAAPVHKVSLSSFHIDQYEVSQALYEQITGKAPSHHQGGKNPVERVRWREAIAFCNARSAAEGAAPVTT